MVVFVIMQFGMLPPRRRGSTLSADVRVARLPAIDRDDAVADGAAAGSTTDAVALHEGCTLLVLR